MPAKETVCRPPSKIVIVALQNELVFGILFCHPSLTKLDPQLSQKL
jgi:hypothetical protein